MSSSKRYSNGFWKVYVHINKTNGKRYVGITSQKVEYRWNYGNGYKQNPHFNAAIMKYGWDGFDHIVLFDNLTEQEAKGKEVKLIAKWNTLDREYGYNATAGGDGLCGYVPSEELRQRWSEMRTGTKRSDETKRRMSASTVLTRADVMQKSAEAKYKPVSAMLLDGTLVGTFESIIDAVSKLSLPNSQRSHISDCCKGKRKSCGGYRWQYA